MFILLIICRQRPSADICNMLLIYCVFLWSMWMQFIWCVKAKSVWTCVWGGRVHLSWHNDKNPFMHKSQAEMKLIRKKDRKDSCSSTYNALEPGIPILLFNVTKNVWWKNISLKHERKKSQEVNHLNGEKAPHCPGLAFRMPIHFSWSNRHRRTGLFLKSKKSYYFWNHLSGTKWQSGWVLDCPDNRHWYKGS